MNKFILRLILAIAFTFEGSYTYAQSLSRSVISTAGETYQTPNLTITYVLGEPVVDVLPNSPSNLYLIIGFIQPDLATQISINYNTTDALVVYPNPASGGTVNLIFKQIPDGKYTVNLSDINGRVLQSQNITYSSNSFFQMTFDISRLISGIYFFTVISKSSSLQWRVKLIKI